MRWFCLEEPIQGVVEATGRPLQAQGRVRQRPGKRALFQCPPGLSLRTAVSSLRAKVFNPYEYLMSSKLLSRCGIDDAWMSFTLALRCGSYDFQPFFTLSTCPDAIYLLPETRFIEVPLHSPTFVINDAVYLLPETRFSTLGDAVCVATRCVQKNICCKTHSCTCCEIGRAHV